MIADTSPGIEPAYALSFIKRVLGGKDLLYVNQHFEKALRHRGLYSEAFVQKIARTGSIAEYKDLPDDLKRVFKTAHEVSPIWHVKMQAAFQEFTDNAVSKTVNFPQNATTRDVKEVYINAYKLGCKGITIYRDSSKSEQVFMAAEENSLDIDDAADIDEEDVVEFNDKSTNTKENSAEQVPNQCPDCHIELTSKDSYLVCNKCSYSVYVQ